MVYIILTQKDWLVVLRIYIASAVFQPYRDLEAGDNQSLKFKWRGKESSPGPLAPQAKSLTTRPPPKKECQIECTCTALSSPSNTGRNIQFNESSTFIRVSKLTPYNNRLCCVMEKTEI